MIFPNNIIGPQFNEGDIVSFMFDGSELTLRLPIIPNNRHNANRVSALKDFRNIQTRNWDTNDQSFPCTQLSEQRWCYEDARTLDDIAQSSLYVSLVEAPQQDADQNTLLDPKRFKQLMLKWMDFSFSAHAREEDRVIDNGSVSNPYKLKSIDKQHLNWLSVEVRFVPEAAPSPMCVIPINNRFVLMISLEIESLHYAGRTNPYSDETLKQFERDLFADFLNHIRIDYSPELIAKIQTLKTKTPA